MKKKNKVAPYEKSYSDMDDNFAFIAGYTSGGAPYGLTWEQSDIDPDLPFEEKVRLYEKTFNDEDRLHANTVDELHQVKK